MNRIATSLEKSLPLNWEIKKLGDLADYINGRAFKPEDWSTNGLPIIRIENLTDPSAPYNSFDGSVEAKNLVNDGDLLLSWSATLDAFLWNRGQAVLNQHIFKVCENKDLVERKFLYFLLRATMSRIRLQIHGATMRHITRPIFESIRVLIPKDLNEQQEISNRLEILTAQAHRVIQSAERQLKAALLLSQSIVNREMEEAGAPEGALINVLRSLPTSGWPHAYGNKSEGVPFLTLTSVFNFKYDGTQVKYTDHPVNENSDYWAQPGDIFLSRSNTPELVGQAAIYDGTPARVVFPDLLIRLQPDPNKADIRFVHYWLMSQVARKYITSNARGSSGTMKKITLEMVQALPFPSHLEREQQELIANSIEQEIMAAEKITVASKLQFESANALPNSFLHETFGSLTPSVEN